MSTKNERKVFQKILSCSHEELKSIFDFREEANIYIFTAKGDPQHYITVGKERSGDPFWTPVNADFGFARTAGSNNYRELLDVAKQLTQAFGVPLSW